MGSTETVKSIDKRQSLKIVTGNRLITADGLSTLSLNARKLFLLAIAQCKWSDKEFYEYRTTPSELAEIWGVKRTNVYKEAESVGKELMRIVIKIQTEDNKGFELRHLFEKCVYTDDKEIYFQLHKDMSDQLLGLRQNYTQPQMWDFMRMRSKYSVEIWHLLQREMKSFKPGIGENLEFYVSIDEIRKVTGTESKLKQVGELKKVVLDTAIKEIRQNCLCDVTYTNVKKGRYIIGFDFTVTNSYMKIDPEKMSYRTRLKARRAELIRKRANHTIIPKEEYELKYLEEQLQQMSMEDYDENGKYIDDYDEDEETSKVNEDAPRKSKLPKTKAEYEKAVENSKQTEISKEILDSGFVHEKEPHVPTNEEWGAQTQLMEDYVEHPDKYLTEEEMKEDIRREKEEKRMEIMFKEMVEHAGGIDKFMVEMRKIESKS